MIRQLRPLVAATAAATVLGVPAIASAANPPACDPAVYPRSFLVFESVYSKNTRWVQMRERDNITELSDQSDAEYPFPLRVDLSKSPSSTHMIHSYPKDQVPVRFKHGETATVTTTYVEVHTSYDILGVHNVRCTRVVRTHYKAPPGRKSPHYHG
ncbi:MAG: hypothetical protein QOH38_218 [Thermoleophilaceae bacterium]|jgi:hypothetical protein|nr:hypothetical protein [Thermoleophilaceae bacterium]